MSSLRGRQSNEVSWDILYSTSSNLPPKHDWCFLLVSLAFFSEILHVKTLLVTNSLSNTHDMFTPNIIRTELQV